MKVTNFQLTKQKDTYFFKKDQSNLLILTVLCEFVWIIEFLLIINVSSGVGKFPLPLQSLYGSTK